MKTSIVFSILLVTRNFCGGIQINQTDSCPMTEAQWNKKKEEVTCQKGEGYFCSLNENNAFITGCLPAISISPNVVNCPFVVTATGTDNLPYERKYTPCNITLIGCPQNNHPGYTILELYKYPLCLLRPEDRDHNITSYPDTTTKSLSTLSTVESENTTINNEDRDHNITSYPDTRKDGGSNDAAKVAAIVISLVLLLAVIASVAVTFVLWKRRSPDRGVLQFVQDLVRCNTCRFGYSKTSTNDDVELQIVSSKTNSERGSSSGESLPVSDIDESEDMIQKEDIGQSEYGNGEEVSSKTNSEKGSSSGESLPVSDIDESEDMIQKEDIGQSEYGNGEEVYRRLIDIVERGDERNLRRLLRLELKAITEKNTCSFTVEHVKDAICRWIKKWDRPQPLKEFCELLCALDDNISLFDLSLQPKDYKCSISMLVYAGRRKRKETVSFLLKNSPTSSLQSSDMDANSILHYAVDMNSLQLTKKVLQLDNTLLNNCNIDGKTAFIKAAELKCADIVQFLLEQCADVRDEDDSFEKITELCVRNMWKEIFDSILLKNRDLLLLHKDCDVFNAGKVVRCILHLYNEDRHQFFESTLRFFPDLLSNSAYYLKQHPLIWSVCAKNRKAIELLLSKAKPEPEDLFNITDNAHNNLLFLCISNEVAVDIMRNKSILTLVNSKDRYNRSPIMRAVKLGNKPYFDALLDYPETRLHHRDKNGENVLHLAVRKKTKWYRKTEKLLNHRDKDLLLGGDNGNMTPLMLAVSLNKGPRLLSLLLERGSEINDIDEKGRTVFHLCAESYQMVQTHTTHQESENGSGDSSKIQIDWKEHRKKCIKVLLKCEKFRKSRHLLRVKDRRGKTPFDIAKENKDTECLELFEESVSSEIREEIECNGVHGKML